jgi:hypothetical protein
MRFIAAVGCRDTLARRPALSHESNERIPDRLLHSSSVAPSNVKLFDDRVDYDALAHKLADGVAHVLIITAWAIDPGDHQHVTSPKLVKEPPPLKYRAERSDAMAYRKK